MILSLFKNVLKVSLLSLIFLCSCSTIDFKAKGTMPAKISPQLDHHHYVEKEGVKEFYFWGLVPSKHTVYVDQELKDAGLISSANISVSSYASFVSVIKGILSLGMYTPLNYKVSGYGVRHNDE